jgi:hypothetical protein
MSSHRLNSNDGRRICEICDHQFVGQEWNEWGPFHDLAVRPRGRYERVYVCDDCCAIVTRRVPWYRPSAVVEA